MAAKLIQHQTQDAALGIEDLWRLCLVGDSGAANVVVEVWDQQYRNVPFTLGGALQGAASLLVSVSGSVAWILAQQGYNATTKGIPSSRDQDRRWPDSGAINIWVQRHVQLRWDFGRKRHVWH